MRLLLLILSFSIGFASHAVEPDEVLQDPVLEERAREISQLLRCLVCQNETIDESNAPLARDLRLLVRDLLLDGKSNSEVIDHIVARYGSFVLFKPSTEGFNLVLYLAGPFLLVVAALTAFLYLRRQDRMSRFKVDALDAGESAAIQRLTGSASEPDSGRIPETPDPDAPQGDRS